MKSKIGLIRTAMLLVLLAASVSLGGCAYITGEAIRTPPSVTTVTAVKNVTPEEAYQLFMLSSKWVHAIDVRTPQEYAGGHLLGAANIDFSSADFKEKINELDKDAAYLVYCRSGGRSAAASAVMLELGFRDINNMTGGFSAWQAAGLPVEH